MHSCSRDNIKMFTIIYVHAYCGRHSLLANQAVGNKRGLTWVLTGSGRSFHS